MASVSLLSEPFIKKSVLLQKNMVISTSLTLLAANREEEEENGGAEPEWASLVSS